MKQEKWIEAIAEIAGDRESGAAEIARRCVEAFSSYAIGELSPYSLDTLIEDLLDASMRLLSGQSSMAPVLRICNDVLLTAEGSSTAKEAMAQLQSIIEDYQHQMRKAEAELIGQFLAYTEKLRSVVTLSYSSTVANALRAAGTAGRELEVTVLESRPANEGRRLATVAAEAGLQVALVVDGAAWAAMTRADLWISGADALLTGGVVNKLGTASLAAAAHVQGKQGMALAETLKIWPQSIVFPPYTRFRADEGWNDMPSDNLVASPIFETVPWHLVAGVVSEEGFLAATDIRDRAASISVSSLLARHFV